VTGTHASEVLKWAHACEPRHLLKTRLAICSARMLFIYRTNPSFLLWGHSCSYISTHRLQARYLKYHDHVYLSSCKPQRTISEDNQILVATTSKMSSNPPSTSPSSTETPSSTTAVSTTTPTTSSASPSPPTPNPEQSKAQTEARAAVLASLSSASASYSSALQTHATDLHANAAAINAQQAQLSKEAKGLAGESRKLEKEVDKALKGMREFGDVQNWAEMLERDFMVLEETMRLVEGEVEVERESGGSTWR
jgi:hypothetical protein